MSKILIVLTMALMIVCSGFAEMPLFAYVVYTDYASFSAAAGSTELYDFESDTVGGNYKIHDFGDFSVNGSSLYAVTIQNVNTNELFFNTSRYTQNMAVTFNRPVTAFGFDWRNTDNNNDMIRVIFGDTQYVLGAKDESGFWGIVGNQGEITSSTPFLFGDTAGGAGWTSGNLDNFRYGSGGGNSNPVPEPATILLLGSGLAALFVSKKKTA